MKHNGGIRMIVLAVITALCITGILVAAFLFNSVGDREQSIHLPEKPEEQPTEEVPQSPFLELTAENIAQVIGTLQRPMAYRQNLTVTTAWAQSSTVQTIEVVHSPSCTRTDVTGTQGTSHTLTDGTTLYLWYDRESSYISRDNSAIEADDLAHIPTYEDVMELPPEQILTTEYRTEDDGNSYLFVSFQNGDYTEQFWIDVTSGLLARAETLYQQTAVYTMRQTQLTLLDAAALDSSVFTLPDGKMPFAASEEQKSDGGDQHN